MAPLQQQQQHQHQQSDDMSVSSVSSVSECTAPPKPWFPMLLNENGEPSNFMDCVINGLEHSIDILSCEQLAVPIPHATVPPVKLEPLDYAKAHDEFLESLFQEQLRNNQAQLSALAGSNVMPNDRKSAATTAGPVVASSTESDIVIPTLSDSSATDEDDSTYQNSRTTTEQQQIPEQLRRPLKLSRRSPLRQARKQISNRQVVPMMQDQEPRRKQQQTHQHCEGDEDDATIQSVVSCMTLSQLKDPPFYLADSVKLQKDKGKGETPGSDICATGKAACLEKLRQKVELLTQVAVGNEGAKAAKKTKVKKSKSASMKRAKAKVAEQTPLYTETRSVIDLKMGFLAIQYGVLCQWDRSGKIVLVVLRKMCHESFYKKEMRLTTKSTVPEAVLLRDEPPIVQENNIILHRLDGTEVTLLEPPFRVSRPANFVPSILTVSIHRLEGFKFKSLTLKLTLDGVSHKIKCALHDGIMTPILDQPTEWLLDQTMELNFLVQLYEPRKPRRKRLLSTEQLLVNLLDGSRISATRTISLPVRQGVLVFSMALKSDYCQWLYQELEARRKEEMVRQVQPSAVYTPYIEEPVVEKESYLWIDLCCT